MRILKAKKRGAGQNPARQMRANLLSPNADLSADEKRGAGRAEPREANEGELVEPECRPLCRREAGCGAEPREGGGAAGAAKAGRAEGGDAPPPEKNRIYLK